MSSDPSRYPYLTWREHSNEGQKTSMSVPMGVDGRGRKIIYKYDNTGKQVGMDVVPCYIADANLWTVPH